VVQDFTMALQQLLGTIATSQFLEQHYLKLPFALAGGCRHLCHLGTWAMLDRLLRQPLVDVIVGSQGQQFEGTAPADAEAARPLVAAGYTIGVRHAQRQDPELQALADAFERDLLAPVDIHLYCTPSGKPGFGWHYDAEEVFVLQTAGSKEWSLRKNTVNPWPTVETLPSDMRYEREIMPLARCKLLAGDWLYIPNGYWHRTEAGEESISLSVGLASLSGLDVFDFLRGRLLSSLRWRQRLPVLGAASSQSTEELVASCQSLFAELGQDLAGVLSKESFAREFIQAQREAKQ
jgi:ribosomal protein L16 Arg81 hydroxylase